MKVNILLFKWMFSALILMLKIFINRGINTNKYNSSYFFNIPCLIGKESYLKTEQNRKENSTMRNYEIVFLVHPDQSEQVPAMVTRYEDIVKEHGGKVHRVENWGRRNLEYPINKVYKATYVLMNVETTKEAIEALETNFRFNDAVIRSLVMRVEEAYTEASPLAKTEEKAADQE